MDRVIRPIGHRSGHLTVTSRYVDERTGEWCLCVCECGRTASVRDERLDGAQRVSCGDEACEHRQPHEVPSAVGSRYVYEYQPGYRVGSLTVLGALGDGTTRFRVRCDCGREVVVYGSHLAHGTDGTTCGRDCPTKRRRVEGHARRRLPDIQRKRYVVQVLLPVETYVALLEAAGGQDLSAYARGVLSDHLATLQEVKP